MAISRFRIYGFYAYIVSSVGFLVAAIIAAWPAIHFFITNDPASTIDSPEYSLNRAVVLSAFSLYLGVRSYICYRLNQRVNHEPDHTIWQVHEQRPLKALLKRWQIFRRHVMQTLWSIWVIIINLEKSKKRIAKKVKMGFQEYPCMILFFILKINPSWSLAELQARCHVCV